MRPVAALRYLDTSSAACRPNKRYVLVVADNGTVPSQSFSSEQFLLHVGQRLVMEFQHASLGTTPTLAGDSREHPARQQLEKLLPPAAGVGSGVVIDCGGNVSKQQDIVIYDQAVTPVLSLNDNPSATYYPIEGVIAVGEIKTAVGRTELEDAFAKVRSVQHLRRCVGPTPEVFRPYGMSGSIQGAPHEAFDQTAKATDQIFGFLMCKSMSTTPQTVIANARALWDGDTSVPGLGAVVAIEQGIIQPLRDSSRVTSIRDADAVHFDADGPSSFARLVEVLSWVVRNGRSTPADAFGHYLRPHSSSQASGSVTVPLLFEPPSAPLTAP